MEEEDPARAFDKVAYAWASGKHDTLQTRNIVRNMNLFFSTLPPQSQLFTDEDARFRLFMDLLDNKFAIRRQFDVAPVATMDVIKELLVQQLPGSKLSYESLANIHTQMLLPSNNNSLAHFHILADCMEIILTSTTGAGDSAMRCHDRKQVSCILVLQ